MTPAQTRLFWKAVASLREAETVTNLSGVSGPADEPPRQESDEQSFVADWVSRAKHALAKGREYATAPEKWIRDRAGRVVHRIREGAIAINRATFGRAAKALAPVQQAVNAAEFGFVGFSVLATVALAYLGWRLFLKKG